MESSRAPSSTFSVAEASSEVELQALAPDWRDLYQRCPQATIFQSPDWLIPWARHFTEGEAWVLSLRSQGCLVAVAPLYLLRGAASERQLFLLGIGNTDCLDVLIEPGLENSAAPFLLNFLQQRQDLWDVCDWQELRAGSVLLSTDVPETWSSELMVQGVCPVLSLGAGAGGLKAVVPRHMFDKLADCRRRTGKAHRMEIETADEDNFEELFGALLKLHAARGRDHGRQALLGEPQLEAFHREVGRACLKVGTLRLYGLRLDGRIVAALYGFTSHRRMFHYFSGFDPQYAPFSPGSLVIGYAIEQALAEQCREFDFLRGRESYKYLWGAKGRLNCRRRLRHNRGGMSLKQVPQLRQVVSASQASGLYQCEQSAANSQRNQS